MLVVFDILFLKMSEHNQSKSAQGIITSDTVQAKRDITKKTLFIIIGITVFIILVIGGVLIGIGIKSKTPSTVTQNQSSSLPSAKQAISAAQTELNSANSSQAKSNAYYDLGSAYLSNGQAAQAITALQDSNSKDLGTFVALGYAYHMVGNNTQAISSFQQAVAFLQKSNNTQAQDSISKYNNIIQRLQQGEPI